MIAATALRTTLPPLTNNRRPFRRIAGLTIRSACRPAAGQPHPPIPQQVQDGRMGRGLLLLAQGRPYRRRLPFFLTTQEAV